jgi:hypothetical protein
MSSLASEVKRYYCYLYYGIKTNGTSVIGRLHNFIGDPEYTSRQFAKAVNLCANDHGPLTEVKIVDTAYGSSPHEAMYSMMKRNPWLPWTNGHQSVFDKQAQSYIDDLSDDETSPLTDAINSKGAADKIQHFCVVQ